MARDGARTLRDALKASTRTAHDLLDSAMATSGCAQGEDYANFLAVQHSARQPLEHWMRSACPHGMMPPAQCPLLAEDLQQLGRTIPAPVAVEPGDGGDWRGLAWALGGSSLGNRAMLVRRRKAGIAGPDTFLSDKAMPLYFRKLLPILEQPVSQSAEAAAIRTAHQVFAAFEAAMERQAERLAA